VIRHIGLEAEPAEPPVGQVEMNLLAQSTLGADAVAVAHQQHPDHQLRVDRGAADVAVIRSQVTPHSRQINEAVDLPQQVIPRYVSLDAEAEEQRLLHHRPLAHHRPNLLLPGEVNQDPRPASREGFFNTIRPKRPRPLPFRL